MSSEESSAGLAGSTATSSSGVSLIPPTFEECVFQPQLFLGFMSYLGKLKANENLLFIKYAALFSLLNRPVPEKYAVACRIIWSFIGEGCTCPVNISADTRNKLGPFMWRDDGFTLMKDDMFDEAVNEIKMLLTPMFNTWLETNEWQSIPFFHTPPPSISVILRLPSVRDSFVSFLDERRKEPYADKAAAELDYNMFQMCIKLNDVLKQTKAEGVSAKENERKARHFFKAQKAEMQSIPVLKSMKVPKHQHKKKTHESDPEAASHSPAHSPLHSPAAGSPGDDDSLSEQDHQSCVGFLGEALENLSVELMSKECYEQFVERKNWNFIDIQRASLHQTIDKDGYAEIPTLAAILHSPTYGPLIMECLKGTEKRDQLAFLLDAQEFYSKFHHKSKLTLQDRKEMETEAARIYEQYFSGSDLEVPKRVKTEMMKIIHSASRVTPTIFQIAGSWIFNRIENSWIREANSLTLWADHDFDNRSPEVQEMNELYNISHVTENPTIAGENLGLVPHPDDILGNPQLFESFHKFVPSTKMTRAIFGLISGSKEVLTCPKDSRKAKFEELFEYMEVIAKENETMKPALEEIRQHYAELGESLNPLVFWRPAFGVTKGLMRKAYSFWVSRCKSAYKSGEWKPVEALTLVGGHAVPGTTWITVLGVMSDTEHMAKPSTKKKWGFRVHKTNSSSSEKSDAPVQIAGGYKSASFQTPASSTNVTRIVVSPPEDAHKLMRGRSSADLNSLSRKSSEENLDVSLACYHPKEHSRIAYGNSHFARHNVVHSSASHVLLIIPGIPFWRRRKEVMVNTL